MPTLYITQNQIAETLSHLQKGGQEGTECVVLWLGRNEGDHISVQQVYRPEQWAEADIFRIPAPSMRAVMNTLVSNQLIIAAQVHSHPFEAFHSRADDAWAIVRHVDALSLVLPYFAMETQPESFLDHMKAFQLSPANLWLEVPEAEVSKWLQIH